MVGTIKNLNLADEVKKESYYYSFRQYNVPNGFFVVRSGLPTGGLVQPVRDAVLRADQSREAAERALERALVVTHGGPVRAACARLAGLAPDHLVPVPNASITVIELRHGGALASFAVRPVPPDAPRPPAVPIISVPSRVMRRASTRLCGSSGVVKTVNRTPSKRTRPSSVPIHT